MKNEKKISTSARDFPTHLSNTRPEIEKIRQRAYELYIERGAEDGYNEEDWLRAEAEITSRLTKSTAA